MGQAVHKSRKEENKLRAIEEIIADFEKRIAALEGQVQAQHSVEKLVEELEFYTKTKNLKGS